MESAGQTQNRKANENRMVEVFFPTLIHNLLILAASPPGQGMDGYMFWVEKWPEKPMEANLLLLYYVLIFLSTNGD